MNPLADRHRRLTALLLGAGLLACLGWSAWLSEAQAVGPWPLLADPARYAGQDVLLSLTDVQDVGAPGRIGVAVGHRHLVIEGDPAGLSVGDSVTFGVELRADGSLIERWREPHPDRRGKALLGIGAMLLAFLGLPLAFAVRGGRVVARA